MKKALKQFGYKLIVVLCVVATFFCFAANTPVSYASKVKSGSDFYYSGTVKGSYTVDKGFLEKIINALGAILDYILGLMTMGSRMVFVGWTALIERGLTWLLEGAAGVEINVAGIDSTSLIDSEEYITVESIVFNHVPLFNINVFDLEVSKDYDSLGRDLVHDKDGNEIPEDQRVKSDIAPDSIIVILKETIAGWYYSFRLISLMVMLVLLIYIGIKLAISSVARERALYKQVLIDWAVGMILVFTIHYIILAMITFNEMLVDQISKMRVGYGTMEAYEYGIQERAETGVTSSEMEKSIYDEVRTRAYDAKLSVGTTGMIMYMVLVYYAWKFSFIYLKRYLVIAVLIMMAPIIAVYYAYNKVKSGKTVVFTNWFKELLFLILLQSIHALMYVIFFEGALAISLSSIGGMILSFVMLNFMSKAEEIFRKIFDVKGNLTSDVAGSKLGDLKKAASSFGMGMVGAKAAVATTKFAGRAVSKPLRAGVNYGFGKAMEKKANRLEAINKERKQNGQLTDKELHEKEEIERNTKLTLGAAAKNITATSREKATDADKEAIRKLREAIPMHNAAGKEMTEEEYEENFFNQKKKFAKNFDELTTFKAKFSHEVTEKWREIMDPFQYVEGKKYGKYTDADGNEVAEQRYTRKKTKYEHEDWGPIAKRFSQKEDGVGATFNKYMNSTYLLNLTKDEKKALKAQAMLMKNALVGFSGILFGLPLIVAEPGIGAAFLAKGISSSNKVWGNNNRTRKKNLKGFTMSADGSWHLAGYQGSSARTILAGMQATAREAYQNMEQSKEEHNEQVVKKTRRFEKLYGRLRYITQHPGSTIIKGVGTAAGSGAGAVAIHAVTSLGATPIAVGTIAGVAGGAVLTGHFFKNLAANSYMAYIDTVHAARKEAGKEWKEELKSTDSMLAFMANRYFETEILKDEVEESRQLEKLEESYREAVETRIEQANNVSDEVLVYQTGYDEKLEVETDDKGKKKLTVESEKKIIDKAIIETVAKSGIMEIQNCNIDNATSKAAVKKVITDILIEKGIIDKTETADSFIEDLDNKIVAQKEVLDRERPNAVEEKLVDEAIMELMQEEQEEVIKEQVTSVRKDNIPTTEEKKSTTKPTEKAEEKKKVKTQPETKAPEENYGEVKEQEVEKQEGRVENHEETTIETRKKIEGITIDSISEEKIIERFEQKYRAMAEVPTEKSNSVAEELRKQKGMPINEEEPQVAQSKAIQVLDRVKKTTIASRKTELKRKTSVALQEQDREALRQIIKNKKIKDLEAAILTGDLNPEKMANRPQVDANGQGGTNGVPDVSFGGPVTNAEEAINSAQKTDDVLKMLELQTKIYQAKTQKELVGARVPEKGKERVQAYKAQLFNPDGSIDLRAYGDGTRRVNTARDGSRRVSANGQSMKVPKEAEKSLLDIINRVNSENKI